jgi:hypothetical protein
MCPTRYRTWHFFNNSNTNEDITTKFEQEYVRCVRNEKECVCSALYSCNTEQRSASQPASQLGNEWDTLYNEVFSATIKTTRGPLCWETMLHLWVIERQHFETKHSPHFQGSKCPCAPFIQRCSVVPKTMESSDSPLQQPQNWQLNGLQHHSRKFA